MTPTRPPSKSSHGLLSEIHSKVKALENARGSKSATLDNLILVGVLSWVFVLPLLAGVFSGRFLASRLGWPHLRIIGLVAGLVIGLYAAWRQVHRSIGKTESKKDAP